MTASATLAKEKMPLRISVLIVLSILSTNIPQIRYAHDITGDLKLAALESFERHGLIDNHMYSSYIRPLSFDYRDAHEKEFQVEDIPAKFKQENDDYQPRVRPKPVEVESEEEVVAYVPPPPTPPPLIEPQP
jgi:hypothetical protein